MPESKGYGAKLVSYQSPCNAVMAINAAIK